MKRWQIQRAIAVVSGGGTIAYPTEAVYGIGCSPFCQKAVERILQLKGRQPSKGFILIGSKISQFSSMIKTEVITSRPEILSSWPGPVTWVIPARPEVPEWLTGRHTSLAIRVSAHPLVRELCDNVGPLVSTSANPSGATPARTAFRVQTYFGTGLDYIIPGKVGGLERPTEIRDALTGRTLRPAG